MNFYTITITPDDPTRATTTLRVEIIGSATRITELLVRAGEDGLTAGQLPSVDIAQLLRAVSPDLPAPALDTPGEAGSSAPTSARVGTVAQPAAASWGPAAPVRPPNATGSAGIGAVPRAGGGAATATKAARSVGATAGRTAAKAAGTGARSYRRAPADLAEVFARIRTPSAVADHYGVPRHTAQSWLRTMRRRTTITP